MLWKTTAFFLPGCIHKKCDLLFFVILVLGFLPFLLKEAAERRQEMKEKESADDVEPMPRLLHMSHSRLSQDRITLFLTDEMSTIHSVGCSCISLEASKPRLRPDPNSVLSHYAYSLSLSTETECEWVGMKLFP